MDTIQRFKKLAAAIAVAGLLCSARGIAHATYNSIRLDIKGQIPDVFFAAGVAAEKSVTVTFLSGAPNSGFHETTWGKASGSGLGVYQGYGDPFGYRYYPNLASVLAQQNANTTVSLTLWLRHDGSLPAGAERTVELGYWNTTQWNRLGYVNVYIVGATPPTTYYKAVTTVLNTNAHLVYLDHPLLNWRPNARLIVTPNLGTSSASTYNNHPIGLWYDTGSGRWTIFNQDFASMPIGTGFNIRIDPNAFLHTATSSNIWGSCGHNTQIDDPRSNNNPNALVFATPLLGGAYFGAYYSVYYSAGRWNISAIDCTPMPFNAMFMVQVFGRDKPYSVYTQAGPYTNNYMSLFAGAGTGSEIIVATQNYNPGGQGFAGNTHFTGLIYAAPIWRLTNQDFWNMLNSPAFNIWWPPAPVN